MGQGNALVEGRQGGGKGGGGVPLNQHQVRGVTEKILLKTRQGRAGDVSQTLPWRHERQVLIRGQAEQAHHRLDQMLVLSSLDHTGGKVAGRPQRQDDGRQLDGFRAGSEDKADPMVHAGMGGLMQG